MLLRRRINKIQFQVTALCIKKETGKVLCWLEDVKRETITMKKLIVCDRYEYDEDSKSHLFYLNDELQAG